jgi:hypothetical protein
MSLGRTFRTATPAGAASGLRRGESSSITLIGLERFR